MAYEYINHLLKLGCTSNPPLNPFDDLIGGPTIFCWDPTKPTKDSTNFIWNRQGPNPNQDGLNQLTFIW